MTNEQDREKGFAEAPQEEPDTPLPGLTPTTNKKSKSFEEALDAVENMLNKPHLN